MHENEKEPSLMMTRCGKNRGAALVMTYLALSLFLLYSGAMSMRTTTQQVVSERLRARYQRVDLLQAAREQLRDDFFTYLLTINVPGNEAQTLGWVDSLDPTHGVVNPLPGATLEELPQPGEVGGFDGLSLPGVPVEGFPGEDGESMPAGSVTGFGIPPADLETFLSDPGPRRIVLPIQNGQRLAVASAWISSVCVDPAFYDDTSDAIPNNCLPEANPMAPRLVGIQARMILGGITRTIQTTIRVGTKVSKVFEHAYFVNNYGWFNATDSTVTINGEVRANGNLTLTGTEGGGGELTNLSVNGDLYAARNDNLVDPTNPEAGPAQGEITGDPTQAANWSQYWNSKGRGSSKNFRSRPARQLTGPGQRPILGGHEVLDPGWGWDSTKPTEANPDQILHEGETVQEMPYLGNLSLYHREATEYRRFDGERGSRLILGDKDVVRDGIYQGADGEPETGDEDARHPLVLIGTNDDPIRIEGPVVIPGDVIIAGKVAGRGTIYAGRNVHIIGSVTYVRPPKLFALERHPTTGQVREVGMESGLTSDLGKICDPDGHYIPPGGGSCP
jgi:hypothetical protein